MLADRDDAKRKLDKRWSPLDAVFLAREGVERVDAAATVDLSEVTRRLSGLLAFCDGFG